MRKLRVHNRKGISLVEVMMATSIFLIITGGLYATLMAGSSTWEVNKAKIQLNQELRKAMSTMIDELRETGSSAIVDVPADSAWHTQITFKRPSGVSGGNIAWGANTIRFVLGGTDTDQLHRIEGGTTRVVSQHMQLVRFRRLASSSNQLEVQMTAQKDSDNGIAIQTDLDFAVQLRN